MASGRSPGQPEWAAVPWLLLPYLHWILLYFHVLKYTENYNSCITRKPVHYTCGPAVAGRCWPGIGPRRFASDRSGIGSGALRHARMGIKNKSNDDKTTQVALLTSLLLGGGICASGKFALANVSTRSRSAEGRELSWFRHSACKYIFIYLFIHLSRFFFYYCALCMLSLME